MSAGLTQMIQLIGTEELTVQLFNAYAPHLGINNLKLGSNSLQRAQVIFEAMERFLEKYPGEHSQVFRALNVIAAINSDNANSNAIRQFIDKNAALKKVYNSLENAKAFSHRKPLASMAAFIAIQAQAGAGSAQAQAKQIWQSLQCQASQAVQGNFLRRDITEPTHSFPQRQAGIQKFQDELSKYIKKANQQKNFLTIVIPNRTADGYTRYYVNTSPPERDVLQDREGVAVIGKDSNMTGFEIKHFYALNRVWISETKGGDQESILNLFLKLVLGASVTKRKRGHWEHRLPLFRSRERFEREISLPDECLQRGEKVYLSELEIVVCESSDNFALRPDCDCEFLPDVFRGDEYHSIYDQIANKIQDRFPGHLWTIMRAVITAKLHTHAYDGQLNDLGETTELAEVKFPIKPHGCTPQFGKHQHDKALRQRAFELRSLWNLDGVSDEKFYLMSEKERNGEA